MTRTGFEPHPSPTISLFGTSHSRSPFSLPNTQPQGHAKRNPTIPLPGSKRDSLTNIVVVIVAASAIVPATQVHYLCLHLDAMSETSPRTFLYGNMGLGPLKEVGGSAPGPARTWSAWARGSGGTMSMACQCRQGRRVLRASRVLRRCVIGSSITAPIRARTCGPPANDVTWHCPHSHSVRASITINVVSCCS